MQISHIQVNTINHTASFCCALLEKQLVEWVHLLCVEKNKQRAIVAVVKWFCQECGGIYAFKLVLNVSRVECLGECVYHQPAHLMVVIINWCHFPLKHAPNLPAFPGQPASESIHIFFISMPNIFVVAVGCDDGCHNAAHCTGAEMSPSTEKGGRGVVNRLVSVLTTNFSVCRLRGNVVTGL